MATLDDIISDKTKYPDDQSIQLAEGVTVTLKDLRAGYLKDADYRQKTTAVAEERKRLQSDRQALEQSKAEAEQQLMALAEKVVSQSGARTPQDKQDVTEQFLEQDPVAQRLLGKIKSLEDGYTKLTQTLTQTQQALKDRDLAQTRAQHTYVLQQLKAKDPELDEEALLSFARENYVPRLDVAYLAYRHQDLVKRAQEDAKKEAYQKGLDEGRKAAQAPTITPTRRMVQPSPEAPKSMSEVAEKALSDPDVLAALEGRL